LSISNPETRRNLMKKLFIVFILVLTLITTAIPALAADWPSFRNAANTGSSTETITLPLVERWHSSAPKVEENGAVVSKGVAYMATEDGQLYAFSVADGSLVTGFPVATADSYSTPAVDATNGKVYVLAGSSLYAFNLNGTSAFTKSVGSVGVNYNQGPVVDAGYVYFKAGTNLFKYDSAGTMAWSKEAGGINTQPVVMGDYVYVNSESGQIRKYAKADGAEVTTGGFPISTGYDQASLAAADGKIFFKATILYTYSASDGSTVWSAACGGDSTYNDSPAVANGAVYVYGWDGKVYAFDENTGAAMTGFPSVALNTNGDRNWSSPAVAGDLVFIGAGTTQKLKVLGAAGSANAGVVLEEHLCFSSDPQGFDLCSPIISDGVVFAMLDGGGLYAFYGAGKPWTGGAIKINGDDNCTSSRNVTLTIDRGSNTDADQMIISENPLFTGTSWEAYAATKNWVLSAGYGTKTVYIQFKVSGTGQLSNVFNDSIGYAETCTTTPTTTITTTGVEVGGDIYPMSKVGMLVPMIVSALILVTGTAILIWRRRTQS
jgi:outer membrane protein assembly factor BamB